MSIDVIEREIRAIMKKHFGDDKVLPSVVIDDIVETLADRSGELFRQGLSEQCKIAVKVASISERVILTDAGVRNAVERVYLTMSSEIMSNVGILGREALAAVYQEVLNGNNKTFIQKPLLKDI